MPRRSSKPPAGSAYDAGVRLLGGRAHSEWELRQKLLRRGYPPREVQAAEARLLEAGFLGDDAFVRAYVRSRSRYRGALAISAELAAKRVDRRLVDSALERLEPHVQWRAAHRAADRLAGNTQFASYEQLLKSVGVKLLRRGFPMDLARQACRAVWSGAPEEAEA